MNKDEIEIAIFEYEAANNRLWWLAVFGTGLAGVILHRRASRKIKVWREFQKQRANL